ncbi:unnamed protein product [Auanema sp. JU1783]|nr:unnamed protein product [Auanema sp. JU1783]
MNRSLIDLSDYEEYDETIVSEVILKFYLFYVPFCVIVGLFGNGMVWILIKNNRNLSKLPTNIYLLNLAFVSSFFLVFLLFFWIEDAFEINIFKSTTFSCKINTFFAHVSDFVSVWLIVLVGSERLILLQWKTRSLTKERARSHIIILLIIAMLFNSWILAVADLKPGTEFCDINSNYGYIYDIMTIFEMVFCIGLPSLIIIISNCIVVIKLNRHLKKYPSSPAVSFNTSDVVMASNTIGSSSKIRSSLESQSMVRQAPKRSLRYADIQLTRSLLIVTWFFIILNLPNYIYRIATSSFGLPHEDASARFISIFVHLLLYSHHAFVFYFYIFYSPQMKRRLKPTAMKLLECYCFKAPGEFASDNR